ncbi:MAG TPA: peptidylprolyl isomerase [Bryobacteraceae bacterium]|jgi:peptidyl-prolyl cis-trans isomerase A (cyclophilin A)|nr:peptidylprolyl isomerase [Bryobacteraceae bacterium]
MNKLAIAFTAAFLLVSCGGPKKNVGMERAPDQFKVRLQTTKGDVVILVHRDWSPIGADHFYELTKMRFYDNNAFFRALHGFVVQWGVSGDPQKNKTWSEISIKDDPPKVSNKVGTVVFAKTSEPNSRSTQLFVNLGDNSASLDPQGFTPFGEVVEGMDNIMHIYTDYGEVAPNGTGPNPAAIADVGNAYLEEHFPKLDYVKTTRVLP